GDPHDTAAVHAADMAPRDPREGARDLDPGHLLGLADGSPDRLDRRVDVDDDPAPEPARGCAADADDVQAAPGRGLGDDRANLRGADVQADDEIGRLRAPHLVLLRWKTTWSRNRRSTVRTSCVAICASTPSRRAWRSSQSSEPRRTSTPSTRVNGRRSSPLITTRFGSSRTTSARRTSGSDSTRSITPIVSSLKMFVPCWIAATARIWSGPTREIPRTSIVATAKRCVVS